MLILCNLVLVQLLWFKKVRASPVALFVVSIVVNIGMWLERYVIVVTSLHRDYLTSSWDMYAGTFWDWSLYIGTIGFFLALMFLFLRLLPMISMFEVRTLVPSKSPAAEGAGTGPRAPEAPEAPEGDMAQ
jgi:molybdopterin-containing oxidoreductase family membrane subunit